MNVLLSVGGLAVLGVLGYLFYLWIQYRHQARLRVQLTFWFFLFAMLPVGLLTFFTAAFLNRTADMLLLPGIGESMEVSLQALKTQAEIKGMRFLDNYPPEQWQEGLLEQEGLAGCGVFKIQKDTVQTLDFLIEDSRLPENWQPQWETLDAVLNGLRLSEFLLLDSTQMMIVYRPAAESIAAMVVYVLPDQLIQVKNNVTHAARVYQTLALLKHRMIENNLTGAAGLVLIICLALLSVRAAGHLSKNIHEPVSQLVERMHEVAEGRRNPPPVIQAKGELAFLFQSFEQMVKALDDSQRKLIQAERLAAWQDVARQVSHEIKNSLTPVSISLKRLQNHLEPIKNQTAVEESIEAIADEMHHLERLARYFSQLGKMPPAEKKSLQINDVIRSVLSMLEASRGTVRFETALADDLPEIWGDDSQIRQVIHNIVGNAVEATPESGRVCIITKADQPAIGSVRIEVADEGPGVDEKALNKIFQPYITNKKTGTGLGLAIVQKIVQDHDGVVYAENGMTRGLKLFVELPYRGSRE